MAENLVSKFNIKIRVDLFSFINAEEASIAMLLSESGSSIFFQNMKLTQCYQLSRNNGHHGAAISKT